MVDDTFAEAILNREHVVLGRRLRPYSRWHALLLDALKSRFAGYETVLDFAALFIAVEVCCCAYPQQPRRGRFAYLRELIALRRYGRHRQSCSDFITQLNKFSTYLRDYNSNPVVISGEESQPVKSPWYLYQVEALRQSCGLCETDAWNYPVGLGSWRLLAAAEAAGAKIDILSPEDRRQCEELGIEV